MNSFEYYNNPEVWGDYQYIYIEELVNNYLASRDDDDSTKSVPRNKIVYQVKRGIKELTYDVLREVRAIELDVSPRLTVALPPDYINYVRISTVDSLGQLHPMAVDRSMSVGQRYLQDSDYELLFDDEGDILEGSSHPDGLGNSTIFSRYCFYDNGFNPNIDASKLYDNGKYNIDKNSGTIIFSSDISSKTVVLEYISDGMFAGKDGKDESKIRIHKFAESTIFNYVYYELIKNRMSIPMNEKMRARKEYFNSRRTTKRRIASIKKEDLMQMWKGVNKWIKK